MAQNNYKARAITLCSEFDTANLRGGDNVSGDANDKQVAQALVENNFHGYARIGAPEYSGEGLLAPRELGTASRVGELLRAPCIRCKPLVSLPQPFKGLVR
jgi:hypothetical protein